MFINKALSQYNNFFMLYREKKLRFFEIEKIDFPADILNYKKRIEV